MSFEAKSFGAILLSIRDGSDSFSSEKQEALRSFKDSSTLNPPDSTEMKTFFKKNFERLQLRTYGFSGKRQIRNLDDNQLTTLANALFSRARLISASAPPPVVTAGAGGALPPPAAVVATTPVPGSPAHAVGGGAGAGGGGGALPPPAVVVATPVPGSPAHAVGGGAGGALPPTTTVPGSPAHAVGAAAVGSPALATSPVVPPSSLRPRTLSARRPSSAGASSSSSALGSAPTTAAASRHSLGGSGTSGSLVTTPTGSSPVAASPAPTIVSPTVTPVINPTKRANAIIIKNQKLFIDKLIENEADLLIDLPSTPGITSPEGTSVSVDSRSLKLIGIEMHEGGCLRSVATFSHANASVGTAVLKLDKKGCVTDMTDYKTTNNLEQWDLEQVALRQAAMLLTNTELRPGDVITINGSNPTQANRVYAALLVLKHADSKLKDIQIKSPVPGCEGPKISRFEFRQRKFEEEFIKTHLPETYSSSSGIKEKQDEFFETKKTLRDNRAKNPAVLPSQNPDSDLGIAVNETLNKP